MSETTELGAPSSAYPIDPVFQFVPGARLAPWDDIDPAAAWRCLQGQVARDSLDLEAHVRRVLLAQHLGAADRLFSALVDLFLALGPRGVELRRRMLDEAAPLLDAEDAHFLRAHLEVGLAPGTPLPAGSSSVLDASVWGTRTLAQRSSASVPAPASAEQGPLARAIEMIDDGDLEGARALLEAAVLDAPDDPDLARELQTIYHHSRDGSAQAALVQRLQARWGRVPDVWQPR